MICTNCPRQCNSNRTTDSGYCNASRSAEIASICIHKGEEPPISGVSGICNIFFAHCNLSCCYCQNHDISCREVKPEFIFYHTIEEAVARIAELLPACDNRIGLVSPSHYIDIIPELMERLHSKGLYPTVVYNSNGYDSPEQLRKMAQYIDVYLPDYKYADPDIAFQYSHAYNYPEKALESLREMYYQKGSPLITDEKGSAIQGMIIRHLVLPNHVDNSKRVLKSIAENLSTNIHISLMAQYFPPKGLTLPEPLRRTLNRDEYETITSYFQELGFHNGWIQDLNSHNHYKPNFTKQDAF